MIVQFYSEGEFGLLGLGRFWVPDEDRIVIVREEGSLPNWSVGISTTGRVERIKLDAPQWAEARK